MNKSLQELKSEYKKRKAVICNRLEEFHIFDKAKDERLFTELCFCLLTANANALKCDEAIKEAKAKGLLLNGCASKISPILKGRVRFHNKKACFINSGWVKP